MKQIVFKINDKHFNTVSLNAENNYQQRIKNNTDTCVSNQLRY
jgi:hypothetical protein